MTRDHKLWAAKGDRVSVKRGFGEQIALTRKHLQHWDSNSDRQVNNHLTTSLSRRLNVKQSLVMPDLIRQRTSLRLGVPAVGEMIL